VIRVQEERFRERSPAQSERPRRPASVSATQPSTESNSMEALVDSKISAKPSSGRLLHSVRSACGKQEASRMSE